MPGATGVAIAFHRVERPGALGAAHTAGGVHPQLPGHVGIYGGWHGVQRPVHQFGDGAERFERLEVLDGRARVQYRHNDVVMTVWPGAKLAVFEPRDPVAAFPALAVAAVLRPQDHYELRRVGQDRVAGREADVLLVTPRDGLRFAQRWWADRDSGLLLRADMLGPQGDVLESAAFIDVQMLGRQTPEAVLGPMKRLEGLRVVRPQPSKTQLDAEGWQVARSVAGFQQISCHRRPLDAGGEGPPVQVLQSVFTDGLAHVSVFIEPYDAGRHRQGMRTTMGATNTVMHRRGDWWITVVGEVPMATVLQFDSLLERRR
jgi:sigma-E factor negative regulatory protein RseB